MSATNPTFSVIICHYNDADYLSGGLARVFGQTRPPDQVILVDDGSDPDQRAIVETAVRAYPDLEVVWQPSNLGVVTAGNAGLAKADGDFVAWWSVDDHISPDLLAEAERAAIAHPDAGVISSETDVAYEVNGELVPAYTHRYGLDSSRLFVSGEDLATLQSWRYVWLASSGAFLRRDALESGIGWRPELDWFADWAALYDVANRHGAVLVGRPLSTVLRRPDSFSGKARADKQKTRAVVRGYLDWVRGPESGDMGAALRRGPQALGHALGRLLLRAAWCRPSDWRLLCSVAWGYGARRRRGGPDIPIAWLLKRNGLERHRDKSP
ncbi:MAG: glycosyltransferase family 2 protein [Alphaproteobacteria bacterium]